MNSEAAYEIGMKLAFEAAGFEKEAFIRFLKELAKRRAAQAAKQRVSQVHKLQKNLAYRPGWRPVTVQGTY